MWLPRVFEDGNISASHTVLITKSMAFNGAVGVGAIGASFRAKDATNNARQIFGGPTVMATCRGDMMHWAQYDKYSPFVRSRRRDRLRIQVSLYLSRTQLSAEGLYRHPSASQILTSFKSSNEMGKILRVREKDEQGGKKR